MKQFCSVTIKRSFISLGRKLVMYSKFSLCFYFEVSSICALLEGFKGWYFHIETFFSNQFLPLKKRFYVFFKEAFFLPRYLFHKNRQLTDMCSYDLVDCTTQLSDSTLGNRNFSTGILTALFLASCMRFWGYSCGIKTFSSSLSRFCPLYYLQLK